MIKFNAFTRNLSLKLFLLVFMIFNSCKTPSGSGEDDQSSFKNNSTRSNYSLRSNKNQLATELVRVKKIDHKMEQELVEKFSKVANSLPKEYQRVFMTKLKKKVNLSFIRAEISQIYKTNLEKEEIIKLITFYRTKLGQFVTEREPKINASIFETLSSESTREAEKIILKMIKEVENSNYSAEKTKKIKDTLNLLLFAH